ncbi:hypothetical protein [Lactobacillus taiwanensis]|uniref:hypothetical protein n=1 Tax=Lactobacillus taiwanensis TaxID=508451 RepID=UPI00272D14A8|nr:hypothetical protein [Lactobacillus taiwanensis]
MSLLAPVNAASAETVDIYPDTWVAIDDLEREMPTYETEPLKTDKDRIVSIFYVTWHHDDYFNKECPSDVTKILQQDPTARFNPEDLNALEQALRLKDANPGTKVMMVCLLALMLVLAVNSVLLEGAGDGLRFYLQPNFHNLVYDAEGNWILSGLRCLAHTR